MERMDRTAFDAVRMALDRQPLSEGKVRFAWSVAAGPALARASSAAWHDGTLSITAKSEAWHRELERARPMIMKRLRELLGAEAVRHTRFLAPPVNTLVSPTRPRSGPSPAPGRYAGLPRRQS